jgi:hypothetical protein
MELYSKICVILHIECSANLRDPQKKPAYRRLLIKDKVN